MSYLDAADTGSSRRCTAEMGSGGIAGRWAAVAVAPGGEPEEP
jgi:hypothetical protein